MKTSIHLTVALALLGVPICRAQQAGRPPSAPAAQPEKPVAAIAWLVGGVWKADAAKLGPGLERIETRYEWSDNGAYLHFTTHFVFDKATRKNYDGNFYWDPQRKSLAMWYTDPEGHITEGPVEWSGDVMRMTFHAPDFEGNPADLRVDVTRKANNQYHWAVFEKSGSDWKEQVSLDYVRDATVAGDPAR